MTRRRITLLVVIAFLLLAGGSAWYWQATAVDRQVNALLAEVRTQKPGLVDGWLIKLGLMKDRRTDRTYLAVADDLAHLGPPAVPGLIRASRDSNPSVRRTAAAALGELADLRAVEPLIAALKDESGWVRRDAAEALGKLGDRRALEPLAELLDDIETDARLAAAEALKQLRGEGEPKP